MIVNTLSSAKSIYFINNQGTEKEQGVRKAACKVIKEGKEGRKDGRAKVKQGGTGPLCSPLFRVM